MLKRKLRTNGHSMIITIPSQVAAIMDLKVGDELAIIPVNKTTLTMVKPGKED